MPPGARSSTPTRSWRDADAPEYVATVTHTYRTFLDRLYLLSGWLAGLFLIAIFVLMMLLSAGRPIGVNVPAGDEIVSWCMAATAFLGLAHTFRSGEKVELVGRSKKHAFDDETPMKTRRWIPEAY